MTQSTGYEKARLCHVIKTESFDGYGFNLHAEKGKTGQFIGKVDEGSPAEKAGLKQGDRILEVNGARISNETHKQVVQRIKDVPNETRLLVVTPDEVEEASGTESNKKTNDLKNSNDQKTQVNASSDQKSQQLNNNEKSTKQDETDKAPQLNLGMTAAELRAKLLAKKKFDPKKESLDLKKKYDIVQKL